MDSHPDNDAESDAIIHVYTDSDGQSIVYGNVNGHAYLHFDSDPHRNPNPHQLDMHDPHRADTERDTNNHGMS